MKSLLFRFVLLLIVAMSAVADNADRLKVTVLLPLTGPAASGGASSREGFELALADLKAEHGDKLELAFEDTQGNPTRALTIYRQIATNPQPHVTVLELSSVTKTVKPLLDGSQLTVATAVAIPDVAQPSRGLFRVFPSSTGVAQIAVQHAIKTGNTKAAVIYVNDDYGLGSMNAFKESLERAGGTLVASDSFSLLERDYRVKWRRILSKNPHCIWVTGYGPGYLTVLNQLREQDYRGLILTDWSLSSPDYLRATEGVQDGTIVVMPECTEAFLERYTQHFQKEGFMVNVGFSYDTLMMIWAAYAAAEGGSQKITTEFAKLEEISGAMGPTQILPSGDAEVTYSLRVIRNKQLVPYNP